MKLLGIEIAAVELARLPSGPRSEPAAAAEVCSKKVVVYIGSPKLIELKSWFCSMAGRMAAGQPKNPRGVPVPWAVSYHPVGKFGAKPVPLLGPTLPAGKAPM